MCINDTYAPVCFKFIAVTKWDNFICQHILNLQVEIEFNFHLDFVPLQSKPVLRYCILFAIFVSVFKNLLFNINIELLYGYIFAGVLR